MKSASVVCGGLFAAWAMMSPSLASGQPDGDGADDADAASMAEDDQSKPWVQGVSADQRARAKELNAEGTALLEDLKFGEAADKFRAALEQWDHPAIQYNLALALRELDDPVGVYKALESATAYGVGPLTTDKRLRQAETYKRAAERKLVKVTLRTNLDDAQVTMNGKVVLVGQGPWTDIIRADEYTIVATKSGYVTQSQTHKLEPEQDFELAFELKTPKQLTEFRRRLPVWIPWLVVGAGAGISATGGLFHLFSQQNFAEFDTEIDACGGCQPPPDVIAIRDRAETQQTLAVVTYAIGAAALTTGFVLVYVNRAQPYRIDEQQQGDSGRFALVPTFSRDGASVHALFRF